MPGKKTVKSLNEPGKTRKPTYWTNDTSMSSGWLHGIEKRYHEVVVHWPETKREKPPSFNYDPTKLADDLTSAFAQAWQEIHNGKYDPKPDTEKCKSRFAMIAMRNLALHAPSVKVTRKEGDTLFVPVDPSQPSELTKGHVRTSEHPVVSLFFKCEEGKTNPLLNDPSLMRMVIVPPQTKVVMDILTMRLLDPRYGFVNFMVSKVFGNVLSVHIVPKSEEIYALATKAVEDAKRIDLAFDAKCQEALKKEAAKKKEGPRKKNPLEAEERFKAECERVNEQYSDLDADLRAHAIRINREEMDGRPIPPPKPLDHATAVTLHSVDGDETMLVSKEAYEAILNYKKVPVD